MRAKCYLLSTMNIALTNHWEGFIRQLIDSGRYNNASEVVRAALRQLQEAESEPLAAIEASGGSSVKKVADKKSEGKDN